MLFAPCCAECSEYFLLDTFEVLCKEFVEQAIVGRVIRALQRCFHPECFRCQSCQVSLIDTGFSKHLGRFVSVEWNSLVC